MSKKVMKTLATSAALIAASTTTTAFAEEVDTKVTQTEPVAAETVTEKEAEVAVPEKKVTSEDIKPALDAQKAVVSELEEEAKAAQTVADEANAVVSKVTEESKQAEQTVKDAEADVANATPENIAANQAKQAENLSDQSDNAVDTEEVNVEIAAQTEKVTAAQTAVDTAQSEKNTADQVVADKEADFKLAEDALKGTGVDEAREKRDEANAKLEEAKTAVQDATNALEVAKDTDTNRELKIKAAQDDVGVKSDIVSDSKAALTKAQENVRIADAKLETVDKAIAELNKELEAIQNNQNTESRLANAILAEISDVDATLYFKQEASVLKELLVSFERFVSEGKYYEAQNYALEKGLGSKIKSILLDENAQKHLSQLVGEGVLDKQISLSDDYSQLSFEDYKTLNVIVNSQVNAIRRLFGRIHSSYLTEDSLKAGYEAMKLYQNSSVTKSGESLFNKGHYENVQNASAENLYIQSSYPNSSSVTMKELSNRVLTGVMYWLFNDARSNFGHYTHTLSNGSHTYGLFGNKNNSLVLENSFNDSSSDEVVYKLYDVSSLQSELAFWEGVKERFDTKFENLQNISTEAKDAVQEFMKLSDDAYDAYTRNNKEIPSNIKDKINSAYNKAWDFLVENNADITADSVLSLGPSNLLSIYNDYYMKRAVPNVLVAMTKEYAANDRYNIANFDSYGFAPYGAYSVLTSNLRRIIPLLKQRITNETAALNNLKQEAIQSAPKEFQANLEQAKLAQAEAKTASDEAKAKLAKASADYATALELKTAAEKTLADLQSTPSQVKVAENNLRLAEIALQNAETRAAEAQETLNNFLRNSQEKQVRYIETRRAYTQARYDQEAKVEALTAAQTKLAEEQAKLDALNQEKATLLAEKDRLVQEAKDLADELDRYTNADANLANAKEKQAEISAKLTEAQEKAAEAQKALDTVNTKLTEEQTKLDELQAEYDTLKAAENAQNSKGQTTEPKQGSQTQSPNTISLTNGTKVTLPSDTKGDVKSTTSSTTTVTPVSQSTVATVENRTTTITKPQAGVTITTTAQEQKVTYSRVERAKTLPSTGESQSLWSVVGLTLVSSLGLAYTGRRRRV